MLLMQRVYFLFVFFSSSTKWSFTVSLTMLLCRDSLWHWVILCVCGHQVLIIVIKSKRIVNLYHSHLIKGNEQKTTWIFQCMYYKMLSKFSCTMLTRYSLFFVSGSSNINPHFGDNHKMVEVSIAYLCIFQISFPTAFQFLLLFDFSIKNGFAKQTASIWFRVLVGFACCSSSIFPLLSLFSSRLSLFSLSNCCCRVLQALIGFSLRFIPILFLYPLQGILILSQNVLHFNEGFLESRNYICSWTG